MKYILMIVFYVNLGGSVSAQNQSEKNNKGIKEIYCSTSGKLLAKVYTTNSIKEPFYITISRNNKVCREFYVIKNTSELFQFVLTEKVKEEFIYYPLAWESLAGVDSKEITERIKVVMKGAVKAVKKEELQ